MHSVYTHFSFTYTDQYGIKVKSIRFVIDTEISWNWEQSA
jgi:hypothetical protein